MALVGCVGALILAPDAFKEFGKSVIGLAVMGSNIHFLRTADYFAPLALEMPLLHTWSLGVEDQFYASWPLILMALFAMRLRRGAMIAVVGVMALASLGLAEWLKDATRPYAFYLLPTRAFELLMGCGLALWPAAVRVRIPGLDLVGFALILASALLLDANAGVPGLAILPCIVGTAFIIQSGLSGSSLLLRLLGSTPATGLGRISYSLYLYHWPVLALAHYWMGRHADPVEAAALVALAVVCAIASYALVEQWFTRVTLGPLGPWSTAGFGLASSAVVGIAGLMLVNTGGLPQRLDPAEAAVYAAAAAGNPIRRRCDGYGRALSTDEVCTIGAKDTGRAYDFAVFGDSNADHFVPMLDELGRANGLSGRQVTQSTCAPMIGTVRAERPVVAEERCTLYQEAVLAFLDRNPRLKFVVLAGSWANYRVELKRDRLAERLGFGKAGESDQPLQVLERTIDLLRARGLKVILLGQVPYLSPYSMPCFARAARNGRTDQDCLTARSVALEWLEPFPTLLAQAARTRPDVVYIDMVEKLCNPRVCNAFLDGVFLYHDAGHLNAAGSRHLARHVQVF